MKRVKACFSGHAIEVFELTLKEVPAEEIARRLDIKIDTVYKLRKRVNRKLREEATQLQQELML
jgi:DNA-directed RNA polymerase specialized sigma24 family protein